MSYWVPDARWQGEDAFIIGGGSSLKDFDFELLRGRHTIGINAAYRLGRELIEVCFFSDSKWFFVHREELHATFFPGLIVTQSQPLLKLRQEWFKIMAREPWGLHRQALGGVHSGTSATNLALLLGARRVFLLGFDCKLGVAGATHWHNWKIEEPRVNIHQKFMQNWGLVAIDLPKVFPGQEVINLGPDSIIPYFPHRSYEAFLAPHLLCK